MLMKIPPRLVKLVHFQVWEYSKFELVDAAVPRLIIHVEQMAMETWCRCSSHMSESELESKIMMAYRWLLLLRREQSVAEVAWCLHHLLLLPSMASVHLMTMIPTGSQPYECRYHYLDHSLELDQYSASSSCLK